MKLPLFGSLLDVLRNAIFEIRWRIYLLKLLKREHLRFSLLFDPGFSSDIWPVFTLREVEIKLRKMLTTQPRWMFGHLRFGFLMLRLCEKDDAGNYPKNISGFRSSVEAVRNILQLKTSFEQSSATGKWVEVISGIGQTDLKLRYLYARLYQLQDAHKEAIEVFRFILKPDLVILLSRRLHMEVLKSLIASLLVVDEPEQTRQFLQKIPPRYWDDDLRLVSRLL